MFSTTKASLIHTHTRARVCSPVRAHVCVCVCVLDTKASMEPWTAVSPSFLVLRPSRLPLTQMCGTRWCHFEVLHVCRKRTDMSPVDRSETCRDEGMPPHLESPTPSSTGSLLLLELCSSLPLLLSHPHLCDFISSPSVFSF